MSYFGNFSRVFPPPYGQQFVNYQELLINVVGTTGPFLMPQNQPLNTLNLFTVTSMAGVPTSTPPGGSFAYNSATNVVYVYIAGTGWVPITGSGAVETWAQTLVAGNTSGATNPILSAGRTLIFEDNICIGGSNLPLTSTTAAILIGDSVTPGGVQCVQVGKATTALGAGCTLIGSSTSGNGANATALGYGAQALGVQATSLGYNAFSGTNATAVGVNAIANGAQGSAFGYNATAVAFTNATAIGTGATAIQNNEVVLGSTTTPPRVAAPSLLFGSNLFTDPGIAIGSVVSPSTANIYGIAIGFFASATGSSSICIGNNVDDNNFSASTVVGGGARSTGIAGVALGNSASAGQNATALGPGAQAPGTQSTAVGQSSNAGAFTKSVALGWSSTVTANNQIRMGTATETVSVPGALVMPSALAVGETFKFITLSGVAGTPSGAALEGSLAMDTTNHLAYLRTNAAWVPIQTGAGATPTWNAVLTAGNTSGAVNPIISSGQAEIFVAGVTIGSANVAPATATPDVTSVLIGGGATSSGTQTVVVGRIASASTFANSVVVGYNASCSGATCTIVGQTASGAASSVVVGQGASSTIGNSVAIGVVATATATQTVCVGQSSGVTGSGGVAVGYSATAASNCVVVGASAFTTGATGAVVVGQGAGVGASATNAVVIGINASAGTNASGGIAIGQSAVSGTTDAIAIGRSCQGGGTGSVSVGRLVTCDVSNSSCVLLGNSVANATAGNTGNVAVGNAITFTAGANTTNSIALGNGATVPAGSTKTFYLPTGMTTVAASVAVNYNTATGQIFPVTSARKFKQNIRDLEGVDRILNAVPRKYNMAKGHCHCPPEDSCDGTCCEEVGVIADEMEAAGLGDFVVYGDHERKEAVGVLYDRMVVPLIAVVKSQQERLDILEEQLAKLLSSKL